MIFFDLAAKSLIVAALGLIAIVAMRKSSAATRHLVLALTLLSLCALPVLETFAPTWSVPFLRVSAPASTPVAVSQVGPVSPTADIAPAFQPHKQLDLARFTAAGILNSPKALMSVWGVVAGILTLVAFTRLMRLKRLESRLQMSDDPILNATVAEHCRKLNRHVLLLEGVQGQSPMTWGHGRPVLLLPPDASQWPEDRLRSVVLHELAHIERSDWLVSVFAQFATALFWFNPAVWLIARLMEAESETAADDRVLALGISGPQYASHLLALVRQLSGAKSADRAGIAMARNARLDGRICAILESRRCRRSARGFVALGWAACIAAAVTLVGTATPTVMKTLKSSPFQIQPAVSLAPTLAIKSQPEPIIPPAPLVAVHKVLPEPKILVTPHFHPARVVRLERHPRIEALAPKKSVDDFKKSATDFTNLITQETEKGLNEASSGIEAAMAGEHKVDLSIKESSVRNAEMQKASKEIAEASKQWHAEYSKQVREALLEAHKELKKQHIDLNLSGIGKAAIRFVNAAAKQAQAHPSKVQVEDSDWDDKKDPSDD